MNARARRATGPAPDEVLGRIADYADSYRVTRREARETARLCLLDTLGCGFEALSYPACTKLTARLCRERSCPAARASRALSAMPVHEFVAMMVD